MFSPLFFLTSLPWAVLILTLCEDPKNPITPRKITPVQIKKVYGGGYCTDVPRWARTSAGKEPQ